MFMVTLNQPVVRVSDMSAARLTESPFGKRLREIIDEAMRVDDTLDYARRLERLDHLIHKMEGMGIAAANATADERTAYGSLKQELNDAYKRAHFWQKLVVAHREAEQPQKSALDCAATAEAERDAALCVVNEPIFSQPDRIKAEEVALGARLRFALAKADIAQAEIQSARDHADTPETAIQANQWALKLFDALLKDEVRFNFRQRERFRSRKAEVQAELDKLTAFDAHLKMSAKAELEQERIEHIRKMANKDLEAARAIFNRVKASGDPSAGDQILLRDAVRLCDRVRTQKANTLDEQYLYANRLRDDCWQLGLSDWMGEGKRIRDEYPHMKPMTSYENMPGFPSMDVNKRVSEKWKRANQR